MSLVTWGFISEPIFGRSPPTAANYLRLNGCMVVTIDGPAGAGKSSVARALARRLGFHFLDTGAMYRAVAYAAVQGNVPWEDEDGLSRIAESVHIKVTDDRVLLDGVDVTETIRTVAITSVVHHVADHTRIRGLLVDLQRRVADAGDYVTEGRDQGTVVFPDAICKIFLTASPKERARRRQLEIRRRGEDVPFSEVLEQQNERDERDRRRQVGRLVAAEDACLVTSDQKSLEQVVDELEILVRERLPSADTKR